MDEDRIKGKARNVGGKIEGAAGDQTGDAKTQAESLVDQVAGTAQGLYGQAREGVRQAADQVSDYAQDAYEQGRRRYPEAERYYREGGRAVSRQLEEQPMTALLIAGAVGFAFAWLFFGRR